MIIILILTTIALPLNKSLNKAISIREGSTFLYCQKWLLRQVVRSYNLKKVHLGHLYHGCIKCIECHIFSTCMIFIIFIIFITCITFIIQHICIIYFSLIIILWDSMRDHAIVDYIISLGISYKQEQIQLWFQGRLIQFSFEISVLD